MLAEQVLWCLVIFGRMDYIGRLRNSLVNWVEQSRDVWCCVWSLVLVVMVVYLYSPKSPRLGARRLPRGGPKASFKADWPLSRTAIWSTSQ